MGTTNQSNDSSISTRKKKKNTNNNGIDVELLDQTPKSSTTIFQYHIDADHCDDFGCTVHDDVDNLIEHVNMQRTDTCNTMQTPMPNNYSQSSTSDEEFNAFPARPPPTKQRPKHRSPGPPSQMHNLLLMPNGQNSPSLCPSNDDISAPSGVQMKQHKNGRKRRRKRERVKKQNDDNQSNHQSQLTISRGNSCSLSTPKSSCSTNATTYYSNDDAYSVPSQQWNSQKSHQQLISDAAAAVTLPPQYSMP